MALRAIIDVMPVCEGEKRMVESALGPGKGIDRMAFAAVGGESAECMIRLGGGCIIGLVAVNAFNPQGFKLKQTC